MRMPERIRPEPKQPVWRVNDDAEAMDEMYDRFMGRVGEAVKGEVKDTRGRGMLDEEVKWLALTHKSFDHGRRGFNDKLAFLGKRIVDVQTSLALLNMPSSPAALPASQDDVFQHAALEGLENVTAFSKNAILDKTRLAKVATAYGINRVVRWKPRKSDNLKSSGEDVVLAHTMYSIIGALAMQRGGEMAAKTARERILKPLGLR
ncbi:uncharacterized protein LTR77_011081 [Saxophila tyrrhenica]|uniref:RNase III domain-containing protein n=1 Tax=Saxophila tyrrhenica TaxID=1690608 RepID=A0AAV9NTT4_9PEZI|nr:hypothetical protein LTR77_011081 [Saxophila tyrrhenica]